jgi:hypothetical protein
MQTTRFVLVGLGLSLVANVVCGVDYDQKRHDEIKTYIEADKDQRLGKALDDVLKDLKLDNVPWNKGYTNYPRGELRIYHFRGFYLVVHLELLPKGIKPGSNEPYSYTTAELEDSGVRWLAAFYPFVRVDGIGDSTERMKQYWEGVGKGFEEKKRRAEAEKAGKLR